jgi:hypothetical protein
MTASHGRRAPLVAALALAGPTHWLLPRRMITRRAWMGRRRWTYGPNDVIAGTPGDDVIRSPRCRSRGRQVRDSRTPAAATESEDEALNDMEPAARLLARLRAVWRRIPVGLAALIALSACSGETELGTAGTGPSVDVAEQPITEPSQVAGGVDSLSDPAIAIDGEGIVHLAWVEGLTSEAEIVHRHLSPGNGWSQPETLTEGFEFNGPPKLIVDPDGSVCMFWQASAPEAALYMRCFEDGGWTAARTAVEPQGLTARFAPGFAPDGTTVAVYEIPPSFIGFAETALTGEGVTAGAPALAVDSAGDFHVVWTQFADRQDESGMVYRYSSDGGATWGDLERLDETGLLTHELVADAQGNVHWLHADGTYRRWTPAGGWGEPSVTDGGGHLAVDTEGGAWAIFPGLDGVYLARQDSGAWDEARPVEATAGGPLDAAVLAIDTAGSFHIAFVTSGKQPHITYVVSPRPHG